MENSLPQGWVECTLGDVCSKPQYGWTSKAGHSGSIKYLRTTDISNGSLNWDTVPYCLEEPKEAEKYQVKKNDILVSRAGSVGFNFRIKEDVPFVAVFASYLIRFKAHEAITARYVDYFLKSEGYWQQISDFAAGIAIPNVNATKLEELLLPLPPIPEQHRIVAKLDALMQKVESNKQRLEQVPKILKRFRQSVLAAAVNGNLTEDWRHKNSNLETAEELLFKLKNERPQGRNRKLADVENGNEIGLPETWKWCQLDEIALLITDGKHGDCNDELNSGYYFLSAKDISNGALSYKNARQIVFEEFLETHRRTNLEKGDICVVNTGATVGKSAIAKENEFTQKTTFQKSVAVIKLFKERVSPKFIDYVIRLETPKILRKSGGSAINNWLLSEMRAFWCQLPPTMEQQEIVRKVEHLFALADKIEARYKKAKAQLDKLPQSILAKAFRGELVPQDPADESASVLLERIQQEKQNLATAKKTKKAQANSQSIS